VPRIEIVRGASQERLDELYAELTLYNAVAGRGVRTGLPRGARQGCPVLGTANTCLPDLGGERDGIHLVGQATWTTVAENERFRTRSERAAKQARAACAAAFRQDIFTQAERVRVLRRLPTR